MTWPDSVTIDAFARPTGGRSHWRRNRRHSEAGGITAPSPARRKRWGVLTSVHKSHTTVKGVQR